MDLSVVVITYNEERNLARCLASVRDLAHEIVVLDSFSVDKTQEIALSFGAKFVQHAFDGHIQQKNRAWQLATCKWVLSLDADEALDEVLASNIRAAIASDNGMSGFTMNRLTNYCGTFIHHSGWYPDTKLRLFKKGCGEWGGVNPHDKFELTNNGRSAHLKGDILHYSYYTREDHLKQIEYFSNIASKELYERGKNVSWPLVVAKVVFQFIKNLFLKLGFLDGIAGFNIARLSAYATWRKYAKLKKLHNE